MTPYTLSAREVDHGGKVAVKLADPQNLRSARFQHLLIFVHGFNNTRGEAKDSYDAFAHHLSDSFAKSVGGLRAAPDAICYFYWPGDIGAWFWRFPTADASAYPFDLRQAMTAAQLLAAFVDNLMGRGKISIVGHSMGCRLILEMLAAVRPTHDVNVVSMMAAAVPVELIANNGTLNPASRVPRSLLKLFSLNDWVLRFSFPAGQLAAYTLSIETSSDTEAVGLNGNPLDFQSVSTRDHHSDYWSDPATAARLAAAIDPTLPVQPPARDLNDRSLPDLISLAPRTLDTRRIGA